MASLITRINSAVTKVIGKVLGFESGNFQLLKGNHRIEVPMFISPNAVWISTNDTGNNGCGQSGGGCGQSSGGCGQSGCGQSGKPNYCACILMPNSIIFDLNIQSNSCDVSWFATQ